MTMTFWFSLLFSKARIIHYCIFFSSLDIRFYHYFKVFIWPKWILWQLNEEQVVQPKWIELSTGISINITWSISTLHIKMIKQVNSVWSFDDAGIKCLINQSNDTNPSPSSPISCVVLNCLVLPDYPFFEVNLQW